MACAGNVLGFSFFGASLLFATGTVVLHWNAKIPSSIEVLLVLECRGSMVMFLFGLLFRLVQAIVVSDRTIFRVPFVQELRTFVLVLLCSISTVVVSVKSCMRRISF